jgi:hypothetical protein
MMDYMIPRKKEGNLPAETCSLRNLHIYYLLDFTTFLSVNTNPGSFAKVFGEIERNDDALRNFCEISYSRLQAKNKRVKGVKGSPVHVFSSICLFIHLLESERQLAICRSDKLANFFCTREIL